MLAASFLSDDRSQIFLAGFALVAVFAWFFTSRRGPRTRTIVAAILSTALVALILNKTVFSGKIRSSDTVEQVGGTIFIVRIQPATDENGHEIPLSQASIDQTIVVIKNRLKTIKHKNVRVKVEGENRLRIELAGLAPEDASRTKIILEQLAKLELKTVHPNSRILADRVAADPSNEIVPGYVLKTMHDVDDEGNPMSENLLINRRAALDGSYVVHAQELYGPYDGKLSVELSDKGADKMFELTRGMRHGQDRLAIVLDGKVLSAPIVQSALGKKFEISGMADAHEAKMLAAALLNPLKYPLIVEEQRNVPSKKEKVASKTQ